MPSQYDWYGSWSSIEDSVTKLSSPWENSRGAVTTVRWSSGYGPNVSS